MGRVEKVAQAIKKEIANIIHDELSDSRLGFITIMRVELTKDLRLAKVYFSVMGSPEQKENAVNGIESASGFIRRLVGQRIKLRFTPELLFKLDNSIEYSIDIAEKIERVKNELKKSDRANPKE